MYAGADGDDTLFSGAGRGHAAVLDNDGILADRIADFVPGKDENASCRYGGTTSEYVGFDTTQSVHCKSMPSHRRGVADVSQDVFG